MDFFKTYKLVENGYGYDLILFIDSDMDDVEFAHEFNTINEDNKKRLNRNIIDYIKEKFPDKRINLVKIMAGTVLLTSFFLTAPIKAQAIQSKPMSITQTQSAYNYNIKVSVNGNLQSFSAKPFIYNNVTYVPLYDLGKSIGATVWWNDSSNTVGINKNDNMIAFIRGSSIGNVNGIREKMPNSIVRDKITFAPLRFVTENLGYDVNLDSTTQTVNITSHNNKKSNTYTVVPGDSLWKIARKHGITVEGLKRSNNLNSDLIYPGQSLIISSIGQSVPTPAPSVNPAPADNTQWPSITYIVQAGDTAQSIARKFAVPVEQILEYNYMEVNEWFDAGERIAISSFAPRVRTVKQGEDSKEKRVGSLIDWNLEGKYLVKRGDTFTIIDVDTGKQFKAKMIGGYNHIDIEPLSISDTNIMKSLFGTWQWSPRAVVIYHNGINIASSLSGMPHGVDTIENGVNGHFDLYMKNSTSHSSTTSKVYIQEHQNMALKAAGL